MENKNAMTLLEAISRWNEQCAATGGILYQLTEAIRALCKCVNCGHFVAPSPPPTLHDPSLHQAATKRLESIRRERTTWRRCKHTRNTGRRHIPHSAAHRRARDTI